MRRSTLTLSLVCAVLLAPLSLRAPLAQTAPMAPSSAGVSARVIVKFKADSALLRKGIQSANAQHASQAQALGQRLGIVLAAGAGIDARSHVVFASGMTSEQLAQRIAAESDIEYAVPDVRRHRFAVPIDPFYATRAYNNATTPTAGGPLVGQWYLKPPGPATSAPTAITANTAPSAINAQGAWDLTTGSSTIVVAVLDTGVRFDHEDFGGNLLPGYDMISADVDDTFTTANDGDGRDPDASDPGDFVLQADVGKGGCTPADLTPTSSWHGTETAGLVGALTDNGKGIASVGRNVKVLPVRVLGKCGGFDSDIIAGMLWSAGLAVSGVPTNVNKARVINMSLGGTGACSQAYIDAVAQVNAQGTVIVASAGNSAGHAVNTPANCPGVIGVAGLRHIGTKVGFSDLGPEISISAPGGNCVDLTVGAPCLYPILTTSNAGASTPVTHANGGSIYSDSFKSSIGTSFSAPLVAGTAALMLSVQPQLTPDEVRYKLQKSARAFPTATIDENKVAIPVCTAPNGIEQLQCVCSAGLCGAGMLDAYGAVVSASGVQARITVTGAAPTAGLPVTLDSAASLLPAGDTIVSTQWSLTDDGRIVVAGFTGATNGPTVSLTPSAAGTFVVTVTLTDSGGVVSAESVTVTVAAVSETPPPGASSGGGGALGFGWLLLLIATIVALRVLPQAQARR